MLESLRVSNFALIESAEIELSRGFTAITGETGAGKSVLLGALRAVMGERTGAEVVRVGTSRATVEAVFSGPFPTAVGEALETHGFTPEPDDDPQVLILRREINAGGASSRNFINGRAATVGQIREVTARLVDLHAQHENGRLFHPSEQLTLLDSFGDCEEKLGAYRESWRALMAARERLRKVRDLAQEGQKRVDYLRFQADELIKAAPEPGEDETLEAEKKRLSHAERLAAATAEAVDLLLDGEQTTGSPVVEQLRQVVRLTADLSGMDPDKQPLASEAEQLRYLITDLGERLRDYGSSVAGDPERLQAIEDRLALLRTLKRKYQVLDCSSLARIRSEIQGELERIEHVDWELVAEEKACAQALSEARLRARELSRLRHEAARDFEALVEKEMADLELPGAQLRVELVLRGHPVQAHGMTRGQEAGVSSGTKVRAGCPHHAVDGDEEGRELGPDGSETVEFLVALNPGNPPQPLRRVASGGEVARIMLAIKCVLATCDEVPTLVFDEIDVGISGQAAARVGEKLDALSCHHQLLCITHLAQVAARGKEHVLVEKVVEVDVARTRVRVLQPRERKVALARMLGGDHPNEEAVRYAERLLAGKSLPS